jgi:probable rRNA maturation factor
LTRAQTERVVESLLARERLPATVEISILFADNETIQELNRDYRGIDAPTDVLSFPLHTRAELEAADDEAEVLLGDVVVSVDRAREQAREQGHSLSQEVALLLAHGVLHLVGYDHGSPEEAERMREAERQVLAGAAYLDRAR